MRPVNQFCFVVVLALMIPWSSRRRARRQDSRSQMVLDEVAGTCAMSAPSRRHYNSAWRGFFHLGLVGLCLAVPGFPQSSPDVPAAASNSPKSKVPAAMPGNEVCAKCHSEIYATYMTRPMGAVQRSGYGGFSSGRISRSGVGMIRHFGRPENCASSLLRKARWPLLPQLQ